MLLLALIWDNLLTAKRASHVLTEEGVQFLEAILVKLVLWVAVKDHDVSASFEFARADWASVTSLSPIQWASQSLSQGTASLLNSGLTEILLLNLIDGTLALRDVVDVCIVLHLSQANIVIFEVAVVFSLIVNVVEANDDFFEFLLLIADLWALVTAASQHGPQNENGQSR